MEEKSLIEIAIEWMQTKANKDRNYTIKEIAKKVFEKKGLKISENKDKYAQFQIDFMLCGYFFCCGKDQEGNKVWNLKNRLKHDVIDKDSSNELNVDDTDDDVKANELGIEDEIEEGIENPDEPTFERDEDENESNEVEVDEIEQEMTQLTGSVEEEDVDEDSYDDEDND